MTNRVFDVLDDWRNLPHYQLERRADIFFGVFLKQIVEQHFLCNGEKIRISSIIPEFPIKKSMIDSSYTDNRSYKIDYALFSENAQRVFFLELKTDMTSIHKDQMQVMKSLNGMCFQEILEGLKPLFMTGARRKYLYLFKQLEDMGLLKLPEDLVERVETQRQAKQLIKEIEIYSLDSTIEVVYILPKKAKSDAGPNSFAQVIVFEQIVEILRRRPSDPLAARFAESLEEWSR